MRVPCDEHVPAAVANALESEGVEAVSVVDVLDPGTEDAGLLEFATDHGYVVLTNDRDFLDRSGHGGVLYYDDQRVDSRELVLAVRTISEVMEPDDVADTTLFVPDGWV